MNEPLLDGKVLTRVDRQEPLLRPGNTNCGGCGMGIAWQMLRRAVGTQHKVQVVIPACCGVVTPGAYPASGYGMPVLSSTFASSAAVAAGLAQVASLNSENTRVIAWAGDGGTFDIGFATVSAAAERNEDVLYICYDNEIYGNTGGQRSSATPMGATTTTTPFGKVAAKKDILAILAAHRIPYCASISLAHAEDGLRKMKLALEIKGFRFLHILSPCPTGWKSEPSEGLELVRLAIRAGLFPVYEVFDGRKITINLDSELDDSALRTYFAKQGRFRNVEVNLEQIQQGIKDKWQELRSLAAL